MFYEEKMIDGVMHYRTDPSGEFVKCKATYLSRKYVEAKARNASLLNALNAMVGAFNSAEVNDRQYAAIYDARAVIDA